MAAVAHFVTPDRSAQWAHAITTATDVEELRDPGQDMTQIDLIIATKILNIVDAIVEGTVLTVPGADTKSDGQEPILCQTRTQTSQ